MDWKTARSGWVGDRNFDIEVAAGEQGFVPRVRVYGFPLLEVPGDPFRNLEEAVQGALRRLSQEFDEPARLN
ncbi:Uncharacterised protein [Bordetella trematum]|uniref:hypothetical protein n=1 Tax=Bordetella trematum TaxID=123899 RepID=UPI0004707C66|nr:hypothetical protein [Bordetella trematum]AUL46323.1 hypothetical protein BTL55_04465 [Bordetella trematum]QIM71694.1 hypothetical protein EYB34_10065 [Bordetella trematum]SAI53741.1 Uncharacterised protein [Bordetella trematum]SPU54255.1 Uncharacterised protein [Bordetella trematum]VDH08270.1 Uncharacterised protein [Bordetella trematum]